MKYVALLLFWSIALAGVAEDHSEVALQPHAVHLSTALDHITVLEFGEPVTQAAAGSSAFNIEWRENKVLIRPLRSGASSDLFVWTASKKRYAYELDPPGDAKNMNYAIDNPTPVQPPVPAEDSEARLTQVADMVITRAFLNADRIDNREIRSEKDRVVIRIENVFQSANSVYIRCSIHNRTTRPYRMLQPQVYELLAPQTAISLVNLRGTQLTGHFIGSLGLTKDAAMPVASAQFLTEDLAPGETTLGVIVVRSQLSPAAVLRIVFPDDGVRHVSATFVF
jgi:hypothetical protein